MKENNEKIVIEEKTFVNFFQVRNMIIGFHSHLISPDRGILVYAPVMLFGVLGFIYAFRKKYPYVGLSLAIIGFDLLLYSMWADPYGGWAFGSRYLIPTYAILSLFVAIAISQYRKYTLFLVFFFIVFCYSAMVNTIGAITSNRNPPQVEAKALEHQTGIKQEYTFMRNVHLLNDGGIKSFVFQNSAKYVVSPWEYFTLVMFPIVFVMGFLLTYYRGLVTNVTGYSARSKAKADPVLGTKRQKRVIEVPETVKAYTTLFKRKKGK